MKVSVLIGSRNRPEVLIRCLQSILCQDYPNLEVFVLDDASDKVNLCNVLNVHFKDSRLRCLRSDVQLGVAGGRNKLMEEASGDILCFIDDDAYFEHSNAITRFVNAFHLDQNIGIVACKIVNYLPNSTDLLVPFPRFWRSRKPDITEHAQYVSYYLGTCHAIRREVIEICGMYANDLMFGEEELDLSYRVISSGYRIYYDPSIVVHHQPQPSVVGIGQKKHPSELYYHVRNRLYLAYKYIPVLYLPTYLTIWMVRYLMEAIRKGEFIDFFTGLHDGVLKLRKYTRTPINKKARTYLRKHYGRLWF